MDTFRDLRVWKDAIDLAESVYRWTEAFPKREWYGLAAQLRKSAVSIPSNVAEGQGRFSEKDHLRFLGHARGSLYELETQIVIATRLGYLDPTSIDPSQTARSLAGYIKYVTRRIREAP